MEMPLWANRFDIFGDPVRWNRLYATVPHPRILSSVSAKTGSHR